MLLPPVEVIVPPAVPTVPPIKTTTTSDVAPSPDTKTGTLAMADAKEPPVVEAPSPVPF